MVLFSGTELADALGKDVTAAAAAMAERITRGWLASVGVVDVPEPTPDVVFSWAIELGGIAHENPVRLGSRTVDGITSEYDRTRWAQIMDAVAQSAFVTTPPIGGTARPVGAFPAVAAWPDPHRSIGCVVRGR